MMDKPKAIIVDIDGTLANCNHRRHFVTLSETRTEKDWKGFYSEIHKDSVNEWCLTIINKFIDNYNILLVSGRPSKYMYDTLFWLGEHGVRYDALLMRDKNDNRDDYDVKRDIYYKYIKPLYDVEFAIDDRKRVVKMWREEGITCLQCDEGDY